ncbi:hypothetical protein QM812_05625 [Streptococcus hohhotensis]|jgi:hypothetical protein|uniref:Phage protein n=1 Tax=Streptococcus hohhotensis TaxID=2866998 RepID=A0ABT6QFS7_9STRE|nr:MULTISPECIES: hypothetical protein [Streptococcus]MDI2140179.1 hypothetical protein [Streptococcus sp. IMAU 99199]MDU3084869.1 hypothetical protein [Streptococcus mitis]MDU6317895.1 hypothetical protein [Streptococcus mitis]
MKKFLLGFVLTAYSILLIYSLFNLEKVSLESCILLVALTYYINKKETFKPKVNYTNNILGSDYQFTAMTEKER